MKIFARVAALQNLSAVATELGVTPGTITKRVQALEADLGVRLVDRTTRHSRLTEEGRMFLTHVEIMLSEMDLACDRITANSGQPSGRLVITAPASLMRRLITPAILSFMAAYPLIDVRIDVTDAVTNLHEQGYDLAIRSGTLEDSPLKAKRLAPDRMILVASPCYLERRGEPSAPSDLARHDCLIYNEQRSWTLHRTGSTDAVDSIRVNGRLSSDSGAFLHAAALDGAGILRASHIAVSDDLASGRLIQVLPDYTLAAEAAIWVVYPNAKHTMPRVRVFIDHLVDFCRLRQAKTTTRVPEQTSAGLSQVGFAETQQKMRRTTRSDRGTG